MKIFPPSFLGARCDVLMDLVVISLYGDHPSIALVFRKKSTR